MRWLLVPLALALGGCEETYSQPNGPFASPQPAAPAAVAARDCGTGSTPTTADVEFVRTAAIRMGTDLQRIMDDLDHSVPGGDLDADTTLAVHEALGLRDAIGTSNLCPAVRAPLEEKALRLYDDVLELGDQVRSHGDVAGALERARAAYRDLVSSAGS